MTVHAREPRRPGAPPSRDIPIFETPRTATDRRRMDEIVGRLRDGARRFARLTLAERAALARSMQRGYLRLAPDAVEAACRAKGLPPALAGEEWSSGPWIVVRALRLTIESLESLARTGNTHIGPLGRTADGRLRVRLFPANAIDGLLFSNVTVDAHMAPGVTEADVAESRAQLYKQPEIEDRVALVLGAGNFHSIVACDLITKMFNEGKVCAIKMNPVNAYLGPYLEAAFAEAVDRGFFAVVYGGAEEGAYLAHHPGVDEIHMTGSDQTYESIVWGPSGPERERRKARNAKVLDKPVTAELGNVSPVIVVPGPYTDKELRYQAEEVAGALALNGAFCCCAPRVLITPKGWGRREAFLRMIEEAFAGTPARKAYYPGAVERYHAVTAGRPDMRPSAPLRAGALPWTLVPGLDPDNASDPAFVREAFCPVLFETALGGTEAADFLARATEFANERLWGTLNATLVVHPKVERDPETRAAIEEAIARLRYGTVALNAYPAMSFAYGTPPWGAYPGADPTDIQSGTGWVHNTAMLAGVEKAVMRHPLTTFPKPAYFPSHRTAARLGPRLTALDERASWAKVPGVVATALRG